jgi:hypothetical protein
MTDSAKRTSAGGFQRSGLTKSGEASKVGSAHHATTLKPAKCQW